jgi:hypothetical protein
MIKTVQFALFALAFIALHAPDGSDVYVNTEAINVIAQAAKSEALPSACSRVMVLGVWVWVKECPDEIKEAVERLPVGEK